MRQNIIIYDNQYLPDKYKKGLILY